MWSEWMNGGNVTFLIFYDEFCFYVLVCPLNFFLAFEKHNKEKWKINPFNFYLFTQHKTNMYLYKRIYMTWYRYDHKIFGQVP